MTAAAALGALLCSCGSSSQGAAADGGSVKLGLILGVGTVNLAQPDQLAAAKAAVAGLNARGGLGGKTVALDFCNDKGDPNEGAKCARKMISDKVVAVVGGQNLTGSAVDPILDAAGIAQFGLGPITGPDFTSKNVYILTSTGLFNQRAALAYALHLGPVTLASVDSAAAAGQIQVLQALAKQMGKTLPVVKVSPSQADLTPAVEAAHQGGAKSVLLLMDRTLGDRFSAAAESSHPFDHYISVYTKNKENAAALGGLSALDKYISGSSFPPAETSDNPVIVQYRQDMAAQAKTGDTDAELKNQYLGFDTWFAYYALDEIVKAQKPKTLTAKTVMAAINNTKDFPLGGVIDPWSATNTGTPFEPTAPRVTNPRSYLIKYVDGEPQLITPKPITVQQAIANQLG